MPEAPNSRTPTWLTRSLLVVLVLGALVRLATIAWWAHADRQYLDEHTNPLRIRDEQDYDKLAVNLARSGRFALFEGVSCSSRPPLYPALVAAIYRTFGVQNFTAVRVVQALLGLVIVGQVFVLARRMYGAGAARWAAGIACFYPSLIGFGNLLLSEILFAVLLGFALLALERYFRRDSLPALAGAGVLLGLATLARSVLWPFFPLLAAYMFFAARECPWPRRIGVALLPVAAFLITLAPWAIRSSLLERTFIPVDTLGGRNMMMGNYEHTRLYRSWSTISVAGEKAWDRVLASEHSGYHQLTQGQRDKLAMSRGFRYALAHPEQTVHRNLIKFSNFWQLDRSLVAGFARGYWGELNKPMVLLITALTMGSYAAVMLLGVFGFVVVPPGERRLHWFMLLVVGFICAVHAVVFGHSRYHLSLMPLVAIYAAAAIVHRREIWNSRGRWSFWLAFTVCGALSAAWIWETVFVDFKQFGSQVLF